MDLIPWGATFFVSLFIALEAGILFGIIISVIFLLYYAARPAVQVQRAEVCLKLMHMVICLMNTVSFPI